MNNLELQSGQILSGQGTIGPGRNIVITTEAMASRSLQWLRCEEMTVELYFSNVDPVATDPLILQKIAQAIGSFVQIKPTAYRVSLTNEYVPVWLLGPRTSVFAELATNSPDILVNTDNLPGSLESYRWRFTKPFYLPPGAAFLVQANRNGNALDLSLPNNVNIKIAVQGTQMSKKAAHAAMKKQGGNPLPYASSFVPVAEGSLPAYPAQSFDLTFKNPFQSDLYIQYMTGRCAGYSSAMLGPATEPTFQNRGGLDYSNQAEVMLWDTRRIVCERTPFNAIFPRTSLAWAMTRKLSPKEYLTAKLWTTDSAVSAPQVAMVGYRNEAIP